VLCGNRFNNTLEERKEVIYMKKVIVASLLMVFVFALGSAFAGDDENRKDVGTMLYLDSLKPHETRSGASAVKDFGRRGPIVLEARVDVGTALYNEAFSKDSLMLEKSGAAAGGGIIGIIEDENTRIWNNLMPRG
jgi:hypothetical protein